LNFLLAVIMPVFQQSPLFFWSCFPTLTWVSLAASHKVQPTAWPSWENLIWVDSRLTAPLSLLSFECLQPPLLRSSLPSDCYEDHLIREDLIRTIQ
jgi:hypothetical protein